MRSVDVLLLGRGREYSIFAEIKASLAQIPVRAERKTVLAIWFLFVLDTMVNIECLWSNKIHIEYRWVFLLEEVRTESVYEHGFQAVAILLAHGFYKLKKPVLPAGIRKAVVRAHTFAETH